MLERVILITLHKKGNFTLRAWNFIHTETHSFTHSELNYSPLKTIFRRSIAIRIDAVRLEEAVVEKFQKMWSLLNYVVVDFFQPVVYLII
jgi:hypothetical protein